MTTMEQLQAALEATPVDRLEVFVAFCMRLARSDGPPNAAVWHTLANVAAEARNGIHERNER